MDLACSGLGLQETYDAPRVGRPDQSATVGMDMKDYYYIGDEALNKGDHLNLKYTIEHDILTN